MTPKVTTQDISILLLDENEENVNEMDPATFNALCEGIRESGFVPSITVAPKPNGHYIVLDGNHRRRAAELLGFDVLRCDVIEGMTDRELQEILSAKIAVVRGEVNKQRFTKLWLRVRQKLDEATAMHALGLTSERQLLSLVNTTKRRADVQTMSQDAVQALLKRSKVVDNLALVIRAAQGDGGLGGEFDYLAFQAHGSQIVLIKCSEIQIKRFVTQIEAIRQRHVAIPDVFLLGVDHVLQGEDVEKMHLIGNAPDGEEEQ